MEAVLFFAIRLAHVWQASKGGLAAHHGVAEDHEQASYDGEVTKEECEVENEAVSEALQNNNKEQSQRGTFCESLGDDRSRCAHHEL